MYITFSYNGFDNSGIAAYENDCIEYVECKPGKLDIGYPWWFYEYFTEAVNLPNEFEGFMLFAEDDEVKVVDHCVILRNRMGEIRTMAYDAFRKFYDNNPSMIRESFIKFNKDNREDQLR